MLYTKISVFFEEISRISNTKELEKYDNFILLIKMESIQFLKLVFENLNYSIFMIYKQYYIYIPPYIRFLLRTDYKNSQVCVVIEEEEIKKTNS